MKKYNTPDIEIVYFETEDIMDLSNNPLNLFEDEEKNTEVKTVTGINMAELK